MSAPMEIATDVIASGSAFAGLVLVYMGGVVSSYAAYPPLARPDVRNRFLVKVWFAFVGAILSVLAVLLALAAKWYSIESIANISIIVLFCALAFSVVLLFLSAREIE
jgi:hypothetical protein